MRATTVPGAEHYREIAGMLREAEIVPVHRCPKGNMHFAERFESRADHLERRAGSTTPARLA